MGRHISSVYLICKSWNLLLFCCLLLWSNHHLAVLSSSSQSASASSSSSHQRKASPWILSSLLKSKESSSDSTSSSNSPFLSKKKGSFWQRASLFLSVHQKSTTTSSSEEAVRKQTFTELHKTASNNQEMSGFTGAGNILVAGGTGYIGVHTIVTLIEAGYDITVVDNLCNSSEEGLRRAVEITNCDPSRIRFFKVDMTNLVGLEEVFKQSPCFKSCIHFAGLKAVGESVAKPLLYYENNLGSTLNLLNLLDKYGCHSIVFSSSATVIQTMHTTFSPSVTNKH